ncbi:hypothetical protein [Mucilaginibacter psychrotolerans]|uniref:Uncharacterized protein n=1 Tax=Mucilaginibacter psychrotolerans TaxID=1524096 RepID=A0A4Y8SEC1_9SPHI|nr:hypothetical protein [Mucilaginibacter psychrotolerans]TFF37262.1 hypothetical protein E2R66_12560 [Mucilaginibacter psychrotolerans]
MAFKIDLGANEFAVRSGAKFIFDPNDTKVTMNLVSPAVVTVSVTMNFTLENPGSNLKTTPGEIKFDSGVFNTTSPGTFNKASNASALILSTVTDSDQVFIESEQNDFKLLTLADKGRQGSQNAKLADEDSML